MITPLKTAPPEVSTADLIEAIETWMNRFEWSGELAVMGEWQAVREDRILTALHAMWNEWRDEVFPAINEAIRALSKAQRELERLNREEHR